MQTPRFPAYVWRPTITGTVGYVAGALSGTIDLATDIGDDYWGFSDGASYACASDSIQGRLASLLDTALGAGYTITADYLWASSSVTAGPMTTRYNMVGPADVSLTFSSAAAAKQFGFATAGPHTSAADVLTTTLQDAGYWRPCSYGFADATWGTQPNVSTSEPASGSGTPSLIAWGDTRYTRALINQNVPVANIRADAAAQSGYAAMCGRSTSDGNNLFENFIEACRTYRGSMEAPLLRVYTDAQTYRTAYMLDVPESAEDACTSKAANQWFDVAFRLRSVSAS